MQLLKAVFAAKGEAGYLAITASTGCAACGVGGQTIHAWAGVGTGLGSDLCAEELKMKLGKQNKKNIRQTRVLLIDEVSMISAKEFDKLSDLAGLVRHKTAQPFGGLQVVLCGDFLQLPPVSKKYAPAAFCFESRVWKQLFPLDNYHQNMIILNQIHRQKEPIFQRILNSLRVGIVSPEVDWFLRRKSLLKAAPAPTPDPATAQNKNRANYDCTSDSSPWFTSITNNSKNNSVKLFSRVADVTRVNAAYLASLSCISSPHTVTITAQDSIDADSADAADFSSTSASSLLNRLHTETPAVKKLELKVGARVMLIANLDTSLGLVNGARGKVIRFETSSDEAGREVLLPVVRFAIEARNLTSPVLKEEKQRLEAAIKTRLSQSNRGFQLFAAMGYEAWDGLGTHSQGSADPIAYPLANQCSMGFASHNVQVTVERTLDYHPFHLKNSVERILATRRQVPLILAYAITIHKVQKYVQLYCLFYNHFYSYAALQLLSHNSTTTTYLYLHQSAK